MSKIKNSVTGDYSMNINVSAEKWQHMQQMAIIGEMTTGIVHDLKNQLACIGVNMSLIEALNKQKQETLDKYVSNINRQIGYTNEMVHLILRMGSRQSGHTNFDLALLMDDITMFFKRVAGRGITIKMHVDESPHLISGCQSLISNSILNICSNACDAIGEQGTIEVTLTRENVKKVENDVLNKHISGACSILTVRDTGCGIAPEKLNEIFKPFFTTKDAMTANTANTGMGLGLTNVVRTADKHSMSLTVESELGVGTTFKLYFKSIA